MPRLTISTKWLEMEAIRIEMNAESSMLSWVLLGQTHRYCEDLGKASVLRRAKNMKSIAQRRAYLRANGILA